MENKEVQTEEVVEKDYIAKTGFSVGGLIWGRIISPIIAYVMLAIVAALMAILPVIGWILAIILRVVDFICILWQVVDTIQFCFSNATLTENGIVGTGSYWKKIDLTYDQITMLEKQKSNLIIHTNIPKNDKGTKTKKFVVCNVKHYSEFAEAYGKEATARAAAKVAAENAEA